MTTLILLDKSASVRLIMPFLLFIMYERVHTRAFSPLVVPFASLSGMFPKIFSAFAAFTDNIFATIVFHRSNHAKRGKNRLSVILPVT